MQCDGLGVGKYGVSRDQTGEGNGHLPLREQERDPADVAFKWRLESQVGDN